MHLEEGRVEEMVAQATANESCITCHKTLDGQQAVCRGFYDRHRTQPLQIAERLGFIKEVTPPERREQEMDRLKRWAKEPAFWMAVLIVAIIVASNIAGMDWSDSGPARTANQVRTEHCERSWQNSAYRQIGASKNIFMDRCRASLKELEGATR